jgi:hypothetical protein
MLIVLEHVVGQYPDHLEGFVNKKRKEYQKERERCNKAFLKQFEPSKILIIDPQKFGIINKCDKSIQKNKAEYDQMITTPNT